MPSITRILAYTAAFIAPPLIAATLGLRTLRERERPALLPAWTQEALAAVPRPALDTVTPTVVIILGTDITEITDALGPYEMFARLGGYTVVTAAAERRPTLLTGGLRILPHYSLAEVDAQLQGRAPAVVVVPNLPNAGAPDNRPTIDWLRRKAEQGALMHSWCKGAMALAEAGLLDGKEATAHWGDLPTLEKRYPAVRWQRGVRWVEHGSFVLSAGITSGIDASLRVMIRLKGHSAARRVAREIRYPDYQFALDPRAPQYALRPADLILVANAAYRPVRPALGVAVFDGVGELDLSNVYDTHAYTMAASVETVAAAEGAVQTAYGLTLLPALSPSAPSGLRRMQRLERLLVPGPDAREAAATLVRTLRAQAPQLPLEFPHAAQPARFGLEPVLEDLAKSSDLATARLAQRRMEYRGPNVQLAGPTFPWTAPAMVLALGGLGVLLVWTLQRARWWGRRSRVVTVAALVLTTFPLVAPGTLRAQALEQLPAGTRVRIDVTSSEVRHRGRDVAQPLSGMLLGMAGDTLLLSVRAGIDPLRIPRAALGEVYTSAGRPSRVSSALKRAVLPALAGGALRGLSAAAFPREGGPTPARATLTGAATSAALAAVAGALFPQERWRKLNGVISAARN